LVINPSIKTKGKKIMHNLKLLMLGLIIIALASLMTGCASSPVICPELTLKFCPSHKNGVPVEVHLAILIKKQKNLKLKNKS
jgi:hypothetical protein